MKPLVVAVLAALGCAVVAGAPRTSPPRRPSVDQQAMREAMASRADDIEPFSSSASYAHFLKARLAHHVGDHRRALDELRLALATDDRNPFLMTLLAEEQVRLGELDRAERELRKVVELHPNYHPGQLLMGRVLYEARRFTRAKVHLARATQLRPSDPDAYLVMGQLLLDLGKPDEAVKVIESLGSAVPGEPVGYKRLGVALADRGDAERAERMLKKAVERDPGDPEAWIALAQLLEGKDRLTEADLAYAKALEGDPENKEVLLAAGRLALRMDSVSRAQGYFGQLLSIADEPEMPVKVAFSYLAARQLAAAAEVLEGATAAGRQEPRIHFYSGLVHEKLNRQLKAANAFARVPPEAPNDLFHEARLHRATCLSIVGQHRQALELFREGLAEKPEYGSLYPAYARALERAGQLKEAEAFLLRQLKDAPTPELFEGLSGLYERQGRLADAIGLLTAELRQRPQDERVLYALGAAYERRGDLKRSLEHMRQVLDVNPENANAMNFIGYALADRGIQLDEAEKMVTRALQLQPESGAFLDSLGWLYFRKGDYDRAIQALERAERYAPGEPTITEHLGDAYSKLRQRSQAAEAYRRALELLREASSDLGDVKSQRAALERKLKMLSSEGAAR